MPNIASVLKDEISRIARKELRGQVDPLRKAVAVQRREIATLKRDRDALQREVRAMRKRDQQRPTPKLEEEVHGKQIRYSAVWLKKHREKLGLSQQQYGTLVGVSGNTIWNWESGKVLPRPAQRERLAAVRGLGKRAVMEALEA